MDFSVDLTLAGLHCITPTDPSGEDEPYAWIFFVKVDGSTLRQRIGDPNRLTANVSVHSGSGGPGNLASHISSGGNIHISPSVGQFLSQLRPIVIDLVQGAQSVRLFLPGMIAVTSVVIDQDSTPSSAMEGAFAAVKAHVQQRLNDFLNNLALDVLATAALASPNPAATLRDALLAAVTDFQVTLAHEAIEVAKANAAVAVVRSVDWWNPFDWVELLIEFADPDETVGSARFTISETNLIASSLHRDLRADVRQQSTGLGGAWYVLGGYANGSIRFSPRDRQIGQLGPPVRVELGGDGEHLVRGGRRCLEEGKIVRFRRIGFHETHLVSVDYPFLSYRYALDGQELTGAAGTVTLTKEVMIPEFDTKAFFFIGARPETRPVSVSYRKVRRVDQPQIERLLLANEPADGNYDLTVTVEAVLPNGRVIPVCQDGLAIVGQTIDFADGFFESYMNCLAEYLKSLRIQVKPQIPDNWKTPEITWRRFHDVSERLTALAEVNILSRGTLERVRSNLAARLGLILDEGEFPTG